MVDDARRVRAALGAAVGGAERGLSTADRLCLACVDLLNVDGAAVSLITDGSAQGTYGSSGPRSRQFDSMQFTLGEGPCLESVATSRPVLVEDLRHGPSGRWPAFTGAALDLGVHAVFAFPISIMRTYIGALDLYRDEAGPLSNGDLTGGLLAAELAALPMLDLLGDIDAAGPEDAWTELGSLDRVEVYQATGMLIGQLDITAADALARLRAHAFAEGLTASEVAWAIVERRLRLTSDGPA